MRRLFFGFSSIGVSLFALAVVAAAAPAPGTAAQSFRAGAWAEDISPTHFPAPVNGEMKTEWATAIHDPMHARCLALSDGRTEVIFCVVDACMISREICERAKELAAQATGVPASHILISATHTHSAAALLPLFQCDPDPDYIAGVPAHIAAGLEHAHRNLEPAEFGWAMGSDPTQVFNRRWLMKAGATYENPFGQRTDHARMNPGHQDPAISVPAGPVDTEIGVVAARSLSDHRPIAVYANYSMHYAGGNPAISADYFAAFGDEMGRRLDAADARYTGKPPFVGIMSNGTSGDLNNNDTANPAIAKRAPGEAIVVVSRSVANAAMQAYATIKWDASPLIDTLEEDIQLGVRKATAAELEEAKKLVVTIPKDPDGQWTNRRAIYAREAIKLADYPDAMPVKLQVYRIGKLSIATVPCEVFAQIGLDLKRLTPFTRHFTVELANGYNGYLPTPEQHALGGYETWRARSAYLETEASVKITQHLTAMLQELKHRAP